MTIVQVNSSAQWNKFLLAQRSQAGIFLQSWGWGEFQKAVGRKVYRFISAGEFAQVVELPLPFGKKYWYIPRGSVIAGLEEEARERNALFVRCEPVGDQPLPYALHTQSISPTQTLLIDLMRSEEDLLANMHEKTRYNIRLAIKKGIQCQTSGIREFGEFWKLLQETARRDKFRTHPREYYEKMFKILGDGQGEMHLRFHATYHESALLAAALVGYFGDTATYLHGASSYAHRALMGPYALHWSILQQAKRAGYKFYDLWGIAEKKWPGMTKFKTGFGGKIVNYPGTLDLPLSHFWYTLYRVGRKILLSS